MHLAVAKDYLVMFWHGRRLGGTALLHISGRDAFGRENRRPGSCATPCCYPEDTRVRVLDDQVLAVSNPFAPC